MPNTLPCVHKALKYKSVINYIKFFPTLTLGAGAACLGCGDLARKHVASRMRCEISGGLGSKLTLFSGCTNGGNWCWIGHIHMAEGFHSTEIGSLVEEGAENLGALRGCMGCWLCH